MVMRMMSMMPSKVMSKIKTKTKTKELKKAMRRHSMLKTKTAMGTSQCTYPEVGMADKRADTPLILMGDIPC